jgi:hypothetical protein
MKMIEVEGYKAFHGIMLITPKNGRLAEFYFGPCDWLYKPDTECWYGKGRSFPAEVCVPVEDVVE